MKRRKCISRTLTRCEPATQIDNVPRAAREHHIRGVGTKQSFVSNVHSYAASMDRKRLRTDRADMLRGLALTGGVSVTGLAQIMTELQRMPELINDVHRIREAVSSSLWEQFDRLKCVVPLPLTDGDDDFMWEFIRPARLLAEAVRSDPTSQLPSMRLSVRHRLHFNTLGIWSLASTSSHPAINYRQTTSGRRWKCLSHFGSLIRRQWGTATCG